ncbi:extracellular solute-binding protein [Paenibacillus mendelii]|nr:extracellular solute-binding protein [Paenibacillus mendelii]
MLILVSACSNSNKGTETKNGAEQGANGSNETKGSEDAKGSEKTEKVTLKVLQFWPEHEEQMNKSFDLFTKANPNIEVEMTTVTWDTIETTLKTKIASNDRPDIAFGWPGAFTQQFVDDGEIMDLTDKLSQDAEWKDSIVPFSLNFGTTAEGKIYNLPFRGSFFTAFYNKDLFDQHSLAVPSNLSELNQLFASLKEKGILPMASSGSPSLPSYFINYLRTNGLKNDEGSLEDYSKGLIPSNDKNGIGALEQFKSWFTNGFFDKNLLTITREQAQQQFYDGKAAILMANNNELKAIKEAVTFELGQFPLPFDNGEKYAFGSMDGYFVMQKTEHPEEALLLAKFLNSNEVQSLWAKETGSAMTNPTAGDAIEDAFLSATAKEIKNVNPMNEANFYVTYTDQSWTADQESKLQGLLLNKIQPKEIADWLEQKKQETMIK